MPHRWEEEEISFQELQSDKPEYRQKKGWAKVRNFCDYVSSSFSEIRHAWVHTCCIDKSSSAELQEAINSMFRWYRNAFCCVVCLCDVQRRSDDEIRQSKWFTRGWTLQELLAPHNLHFLAKDWNTQLGSRGDLIRLLSPITGIPQEYIGYFAGSTVTSPGTMDTACVAEIMSWASSRQTTRRKDEAYSLMGLLGVYMALLYGEGDNAFRHLPSEIVGISDDETIFAWQRPASFRRGLQAFSLQDFKNCNCRPLSKSARWDISRPSYAMTNKGIRIEPLLRPVSVYSTTFLLPLNLSIIGNPEYCVAIVVRREPETEQFFRDRKFELVLHDKRDKIGFARTVAYFPQGRML